MLVSTPDKTLLLMLWQIVEANGRPTTVSFQDLGARVKEWQDAGVRLYPSDAVDDLAEAVAADAGVLATLGFVTIDESATELTAAGELIASTLELPDWAKQNLTAANRATSTEA